jgi:hypothetical protein
MIDSVIETYPEEHIPEELLEKRARILDERETVITESDAIVAIMESQDVKDLMESTRDREGNNKLIEYVQQKHDVCLPGCCEGRKGGRILDCPCVFSSRSTRCSWI